MKVAARRKRAPRHGEIAAMLEGAVRRGEVMTVTLALAALLIEALVGYPDRLVRSIGHPVSWIGRLIGALERYCNRDTAEPVQRRALGSSPSCWSSLSSPWRHSSSNAAFCCCRSGDRCGILGQRVDSAAKLARRRGCCRRARENGSRGWARSGIASGDAAALDEGVARAAIESLAENFPTVSLLLSSGCSAGLPGAAVYKAINTADSMIGHRTPFQRFGWSAARLDDLVNLPASRLSALLITAAAVTKGRQRRRGKRCGAMLVTTSPNAVSGSGDGRSARARACGPARLRRRPGR